MSRRSRLDAELVRRGLARSRAQAAELVAAGKVRVGGLVAVKPATAVDSAAALVVQTEDADAQYASRGGYKLAGALDVLAVPVAGRRCLDVGASTGGFTDVLLRHGAASVVAVDVGYGQLAWQLRTDPRVRLLERTNARGLAPELIGGPVDLAVADLSFISLTIVLPAVARCLLPDADALVMVKPQFEVGRGQLPAGGVVRDPALRAAAVRRVAAAGLALGLGVAGVVASPLPGPAGNVEYFLWLRAGAPEVEPAALAAAIAGGPA